MLYYNGVIVMYKKYWIAAEQAAKIHSVIKNYEKTSVFRKLQAIMLIGEGESVEEAAKTTFYSETYTYELIKQFCTKGFDEFVKDGRGGANRRNLTNEQEAAIIDKFDKKAKGGQVVSLHEMKEEYEKVRGKKTADSTFYAFLHRMKWRRVMPRGTHPKKASDEAIEASKKLTFD